MSISLDTSTSMGFHRPLTTRANCTLTIKNSDNAQPVAFKVKTTAPKIYAVRPNAGTIKPGERIDVTIQLQPIKEETPFRVKGNHKFLVESTIIASKEENISVSEIFRRAEREGEGRLHHQRFQVAYLRSEGQALGKRGKPATQKNLVSDDSRTRISSFWTASFLRRLGSFRSRKPKAD